MIKCLKYRGDGHAEERIVAQRGWSIFTRRVGQKSKLENVVGIWYNDPESDWSPE